MIRALATRLAVPMVAAVLLALSSTTSAFDRGFAPIAAEGTLQAAFSPWDDIEGLIVESLAGARQQVLVQAYVITSRRIVAGLIAAKRRGLDVRVLADARQHAATLSSRLGDLALAGIPVWTESKYQNAHNKVIVIDATRAGATVITGSFNFTWSAQKSNAENVLVARDNPRLAARYLMNWERHLSGAQVFAP
ncbi:MAG: putative endonuclease protein [Herminiimonas sp.]|nr:putative endonuclease protein [Herminiimonas sp.]MDB5853762.1 putative endonuclease protein [Herminiimonas sp.]